MNIGKFIHKLFAIPAIFAIFLLTACASQNEEKGSGAAQSDSYHKIDAETARQMIDAAEQEVTIVDVRTEEEYKEGHLAQALLIPVETIGNEMPEALPDPEAALIIYCRSGRRSKEAADKLVGLGYQKVYDMGGIIDWPYDTISEK